jgi:hypothetical protein
MTAPVRRLLVPLFLATALVACGDGDGGTPQTVVDDGPLPSETSAVTGSAAPTDDEILTGLAEDVAEQQRPGEFVEVANITYFDDPDGCASGEAAFVSVELSGEPAQGEILFCRVEADPGWELSQGILYGE